MPLLHTWPLFDQQRHFELGTILSSVVTDLIIPTKVGQLGISHAGCWECDLTNNCLTWSGGVYDLFGLPRDAAISRQEIVALYTEESRAVMEQLRSHAIKHRRGFTFDATIRPVIGGQRRMRLIAAPICEGTRVLRLHGLKMLI